MVSDYRPKQKNDDRALVSVIIPTYNRSSFLKKAISSVFADSYRPIECIVVDDGSTDDTADIIREYFHECPADIDLRYIRKENGGANSARNRGLVECRGDFICYLDSDDYLINDSIHVRATILKDNAEVDLCYGVSSTRNEKGDEIRTMNSPWPAENESRIAKYIFHTNSPMFKRSIFIKAGFWREDDLQSQEHEYFARLRFFSRRIEFVDKRLSAYVKHEKDHIFDSSKRFNLALFRILVCIKALVLYSEFDEDSERKELAMQFRHVAKMLFRAEDYRNSCKALEEAFILNKNLKVLAQWLAIKCIGMIKAH